MVAPNLPGSHALFALIRWFSDVFWQYDLGLIAPIVPECTRMYPNVPECTLDFTLNVPWPYNLLALEDTPNPPSPNVPECTPEPQNM